MTRTKLELREKANIEKYIHNNTEVCVDAIMELYNRIPDIGGVFKSLFRYRPLNSYELDSLENETFLCDGHRHMRTKMIVLRYLT